ncbi:MAG: hypothetical protein GXY54_11260, partial [Deltaproteobacteria bacterium]|nr:hypothetical protein [Deltaproteobacteria bacterium]
TLAVRPPTAAEKNGTTDNTTRIEIYPVSSTGYNHAACQQAVEEMRSGNPSLGQLKGYIDACMGYESGGGNTPEVASRSAFNHSVQDCWYIAKQGLSQWLQTSGGSITRIQNDCSSVYEALLPWEIGTDHNGYVCYGDYRDPVTAPLAERGYVGRCYYEGSAEIDEVCTDRPCDDKTNKVKSNQRCINNIAYQCDGTYSNSAKECNGTWVKIQDCTGGDGVESGWMGDQCIQQGLVDFCGTLNIPEVVDPSDQVTGTGNATGEFWNLPAMMVDAGVGEQLGSPLLTMVGKIATANTPSGLLQEFAPDLRMGAMAFNYDGAKSECEKEDPYVTYACDEEGIRDAAKVLLPIGQGDPHRDNLVAQVNGIVANTWTPLAEAMYNAIGYYRQDTAMRLDENDFATGEGQDPVTQWCQSNNILLITDGAPSADQNAAVVQFAEDLGFSLGSGTCTALHGSSYLQDLAKYAHEDIWDDRTFTPGEERRPVSSYIVAAGSFRGQPADGDLCHPQNLLENSASAGGTQLYQAATLNELETALRAAFNSIKAQAAAGSAASVISSSRGGEGAIYQAIFWPKKRYVGENSTEIVWAGEVHALFIGAEGYMYEDTDGDRALTADDKRVIFYFDNQALSSRGCYDIPVNGTCSDSVDLDQIAYLWSANDWLAKISNSNFVGAGYDVNDQYHNRATYISNTPRRYVFTWNDRNNDGIVDDNEVLPFVSRNAANAATQWSAITVAEGRQNVVVDFGAADDAEVNKIVDWIRGVEVTGYRPRTIKKPFPGQLADVEIVWRLGDVIHSTPTAVGRPMENLHLLYGDRSYASFVNRWAKRRHMIYFGANDGMLHAVNGGFYNTTQKKFCLTQDCANEASAPQLGAEMWAYVPYNLLPHLKCLTNPDYAHKYYVDQRPRVFDARIFPADDDEHPNGWGTVLVGAMRFGGAQVSAGDLGNPDSGDERLFFSSYFVLDITNPEAPPKLLGELTTTSSGTKLGFTSPIPTPVVMKSDSAAGEWYLVLGSGPQAAEPMDAIKGKSEQKPRVAVIPLKGLTGVGEATKKPMRIPTTGPTADNAGVIVLDASANGFVSDLISVDFDVSPYYMTDAVYFGTVEHGAGGDGYDNDWDGRLYRLVTRDLDGEGAQEPTSPDEWTANLLINVAQPITAAAAVGKDANNYWIYFGTGRFFDAGLDKPDNATQSFYGIKEPRADENGKLEFTWEEVDKNDLFDATNVVVTQAESLYANNVTCPDADCLPNEETSFADLISYVAGVPGGTNDNDETGNPLGGWRRDFQRDRERNLGQATLLGGLLTFTTYQPFNDPCQQDGQSFLYGLHYQTGTSHFRSVFGGLGLGDDNQVLESFLLGRGLAITPNLHVGSGNPTAFIQTSTGVIIEIPQTDLPNNEFRSGRRSWREIVK